MMASSSPKKASPLVNKFNGIERLSSEQFVLVFKKYDKDGTFLLTSQILNFLSGLFNFSFFPNLSLKIILQVYTYYDRCRTIVLSWFFFWFGVKKLLLALKKKIGWIIVNWNTFEIFLSFVNICFHIFLFYFWFYQNLFFYIKNSNKIF